MKIENTKPPRHIWEQAHKQFTIDDTCTVYTYGNTLHNPAGVPVDECLEAHESLHAVQQVAIGGADKWWAMYFKDPEFRRSQEIDAYHRQYEKLCQINHDRNRRAKYLWEIASHLASPMYGAGISHVEAMKAIRTGIHE